MRNRSKTDSIRPFLKWPGGKRWLVKRGGVFPSQFKTYIEPFLGSGAVFFHLQPRKAILSDINAELISAYRAIKSDPLQVEDVLERHSDFHSKEYYYAVRSSLPKADSTRAARLIYLNRTCFNGVYRLSRKGLFNVPMGTRSEVIFDDDDFGRISELLSTTELLCSDFESVIDEAKSEDFVFADPPYTVRHNVNGFVKYNETLFSWKDQERLAACLERALQRGVKVLSTNANHESIRKLYSGRGFDIVTVERFSGISGNPECRMSFEELLIMSPEL